MASSSLNASLHSFWSNETLINNQSVAIMPPFESKDFTGRSISVSSQKGTCNWIAKASPAPVPVRAQGSTFVGRGMRWWEKSLTPNMIEIESAEHLMDSLLSAGDKLAIVDFYSPGCGGCKALHPKICQFAESNPTAIFLKVNYEELKPMCYALRVHILPFFRFYRGAEGRVCSFSCTNATVKKFKDALAKHGTDRCSLGPAKGLEESELLSLASARLISRPHLIPFSRVEQTEGSVVMNGSDMANDWGKPPNKMASKEGSAVLMS